jgi:hypothetical protein
MFDVAEIVNFEAREIPSALQKHHSNRVAVDFSRCISNEIVLWRGRRDSVSYSEINAVGQPQLHCPMTRAPSSCGSNESAEGFE